MAKDQGTSSALLFRETTEDLLRRLDRDHSPAAQDLRAEANQLANSFREWEKRRPSQEEKVEQIRRLFDLQRRAMDHLVRTNAAATDKPPNDRRR